MFSNRIRGISQIHLFTVILTTIVWLFAYVFLSESLGWFKLLESIHYFQYVLCLIVGSALSMQVLTEVRLHLTHLSLRDNLRLTTTQVTTSAVFMFALTFVLRIQDMSRLFLSSYLLSLVPLLFAVNQFVPKILSRFIYANQPRIPTLLMVPELPSVSVPELLQHADLGFTYVGMLAPALAENPPLPILGPLDNYGAVIRKHGIQQVIITDFQKYPRQNLEEVVLTCQQLGCRILMQDSLTNNAHVQLTLVQEGETTFYSPLNEPLEQPLHRMQKRTLDLIVAIPIVLFVLPPLMLWVKIMQARQSPGSLFKLQPRGGRGNEPFQVFKFRSMHQNLSNVVISETQQATRRDPRIYPFGAFMRRTSIDEFPQFINVLLGQMSVIGPRPHLVAHDTSFSIQCRPYRSRQYIKPGVTGWAQIHGFRGEIRDPDLLDQRVQHDLFYIHHWSMFLDLEILIRTVGAVFFPPPSAY